MHSLIQQQNKLLGDIRERLGTQEESDKVEKVEKVEKMEKVENMPKVEMKRKEDKSGVEKEKKDEVNFEQKWRPFG